MPEIHKFEAMLKWAKHFVKKQGYTDKFDAKVDFRNCMDRLSRDLKLYRISPQDLIKEMFILFIKQIICSGKILKRCESDQSQ